MNVPKLRFKGFTDKWDNKKINDFLLSHKGGAPLKPTDFVKNSGCEVIPKKAISSGGKLSLDSNEATYCSESFFKSNSRSVIDDSYLVTTLRDLVPSGPSIGYIVKFASNKSYLLAQGVYGIKIDKNLDESFLIHYSNTDKYRVMMQTMMVGSTQVHIRNSDFFKTPIKIPSLPEQTKIANFLTAIDEKISQLTQKHDLLKQYKKGVMQQIFSQKLRFKDDDGREFPRWKKKMLGEVTEIIMGQSPDSNSYNELAKGKPLIQGNADIANRKTNPRAWTTASTKECKVNDIILTVRAPVGAVAISYHDACIGRGVCAIRSNNETISNYIYQLLLWYEPTKWISLEQGSTFTAVSSKDIRTINIPFPTILEQTKIANFLTAIDDKITHTQTQFNAVKLYKKGLLQQLFV